MTFAGHILKNSPCIKMDLFTPVNEASRLLRFNRATFDRIKRSLLECTVLWCMLTWWRSEPRLRPTVFRWGLRRRDTDSMSWSMPPANTIRRAWRPRPRRPDPTCKCPWPRTRICWSPGVPEWVCNPLGAPPGVPRRSRPSRCGRSSRECCCWGPDGGFSGAAAAARGVSTGAGKGIYCRPRVPVVDSAGIGRCAWFRPRVPWFCPLANSKFCFRRTQRYPLERRCLRKKRFQSSIITKVFGSNRSGDTRFSGMKDIFPIPDLKFAIKNTQSYGFPGITRKTPILQPIWYFWKPLITLHGNEQNVQIFIPKKYY